MKAQLYLHTLRHLKLAQVCHRIWTQIHHAKPDLSPPPEVASTFAAWIQPCFRGSFLVGPESIRLLNQERIVAWNDLSIDRLWLYNTHYFDDLNSDSCDDRREWQEALLRRWIVENPPGLGIGWEPYPLSRRIVNWIKWILSGHSPVPQMLESLAVQTRFLRQRIEFHLLGNHLFANAKALIFAGAFFEGREADRWLHTGMWLIQRELPEQILADGGHFERSPMYHSVVLEDLLDLFNLNQLYSGLTLSKSLAYDLAVTTQRMRRWLLNMTHPDGEICLFNDAALGATPSPMAIDDYATRLGLETIEGPAPRLAVLQPSGYVRFESQLYTAFIDVGPVGPDYQPGHAHADTLSFEMSAYGRRVVVDSGTSCYGDTTERLRQRSTAAHNTVVIDDQNSSEVWGSFRVARRALPCELSIAEEADRIVVKCKHNGYHRLKGKPTHCREWGFRANSLTIIDRIVGPFRKAEALFHFHPDLRIEAHGNAGTLSLPMGYRIAWKTKRGTATLKESTYHPEFGLSIPSKCLCVRFDDYETEVVFQMSERT